VAPAATSRGPSALAPLMNHCAGAPPSQAIVSAISASVARSHTTPFSVFECAPVRTAKPSPTGRVSRVRRGGQQAQVGHLGLPGELGEVQ
jgi:hypothetical protein